MKISETDAAFMVMFSKSIIAIGLYALDTLRKSLGLLPQRKALRSASARLRILI